MNPFYVSAALILLGGALVSVQAPLNATLSRAVGGPVNAALVSFLVGSLALGTLALILRDKVDPAAMKALPWWAWVGGVCGAVFVATAAYAAPKLGVATMLTLAVASQLVTAVALDHVGAFGLPKQEVSPGRLLGVALVIAGVVLVRRF